jgi:DNA invertase Pin-like site-specific DNA recombinase
MKAAAYIRVSTETQTTDNQLPAIMALRKACGWELVKVYSENASAWVSGSQTELKMCVVDAKHNHHEIIVVWAFDQLTREGPLLILSLNYHLKKYCARCNSLPWDRPKVKYRGQRK